MTARGNDRMPIFRSDIDRALMLTLVGEAAERYQCRVLAYCLMSNHVHFTLQDLNGDLSKALKFVNGVYAQRFNLRHGRTGHLFDGRFWNSLLETDSYLATATEYVHRNPVDAGLVERPEHYRWSSYRAYAGLSAGEHFLDQDVVLGLYGNDRGLLRSQTEVSRRNVAKEAELRKPWPSPVLGSEAFRHHHLDGARTPKVAPVCSPAAAQVLDAITSNVARAFGVDRASVVVARRGVKNQPRSMAIHLAASGTVLPHSEIASYFCLAAAHSVSITSKRCLDAVNRDHELAQRLDRLVEALTTSGSLRSAA